ncbi:SMI1/KNR4 family protein [Streptomyces thinghirensis]|nr:SMI1/KNR4 family protein [Streptomyces thinghirensis]
MPKARLGFALPEELKALYRVTRSRWRTGATTMATPARECAGSAVNSFPLDDVYIADASSRRCSWTFAAMEAVVTPPHAAVQGWSGSPGWLVFGDNGGGDRLAVDDARPERDTRQIIAIGHRRTSAPHWSRTSSPTW